MSQEKAPEFYVFGKFRFRIQDRALFVNGQTLDLKPRAADVLLFFLERGHRLVTKDELLDLVWADNPDASQENITQQVRSIRRALGAHDQDTEFIKTAHGRGYRFVVHVESIYEAPPALTATELTSMPGDEELLEGPVDEPDEPLPALAAYDLRPALPAQIEKPSRRISRWTAAAVVAVMIVLLSVAAIANWPTSLPQTTTFRQLTNDRDLKESQPLLSSATRVYFKKDGRAFEISTDGGHATTLFAADGTFDLLDVDLIHSEYLAAKTGGTDDERAIWILPMGRGEPRQVAGLACNTASWSPDAAEIACFLQNKLSIVNRDGTLVRRIEVPPGVANWPRWSPDGRLLRFTVANTRDWIGPTQVLWEVHRDGTGIRQLLPHWHESTAAQCCGTWTPNGEYFIFEAFQDGRSNLWALRERRNLFDTAEPEPFPIPGGPLSYSGPSVSPDGKTIFAYGTYFGGELVQYDAALRGFSSYLGGLSGTWISFARDQQSFVYVSYPEKVLWRSNANGTDRRPLTSGTFDVDGSALSPDGKWVAFRSRMAGRYMKIFLIPASGGTPVPINTEDREQGIPSWSPDGTRFVFADVPRVFGDGDPTSALYTYDLASRQATKISGTEGRWACRWSPDGRYLAALTTTMKQELGIYDLHTRSWRTLTAKHVNTINWSHDGRFIYYDTEGAIRMLRRVRVVDNLVEDVADLQHYPVAAYWWSGLTPDDAPLILRNLGSTEVYALDFWRR